MSPLLFGIYKTVLDVKSIPREEKTATGAGGDQISTDLKKTGGPQRRHDTMCRFPHQLTVWALASVPLRVRSLLWGFSVAKQS